MKRGVILGGILLIVVAGVFVLFGNRQQSPPTTAGQQQVDLTRFKNGPDIFITPADLQAQLGSANLVLLDASHPKVYAKGHIPGAVNIGFKGLSRIEGRPGDPLWGTILPKEQLAAKLESLGVTNDSVIVVYSDTLKGPGAGGRAVWQLRMAGLDKVKLLYGGLELWKRFGYGLTTEVAKPHPATGLVLQDYDESYRIELAELAEKREAVKLLDVRSKKEFTGEDTSRGEPRGGHIAGALWLEWTALLNEDSTPKEPEQIIAMMADFGITPEDDFAVY